MGSTFLSVHVSSMFRPKGRPCSKDKGWRLRDDVCSHGLAVQVVYLDVDTLWIDSMANVEQEFTKMREKNALFGMSIETTALNGNGSWYKGGRPLKHNAKSCEYV